LRLSAQGFIITLIEPNTLFLFFTLHSKCDIRAQVHFQDHRKIISRFASLAVFLQIVLELQISLIVPLFRLCCECSHTIFLCCFLSLLRPRYDCSRCCGSYSQLCVIGHLLHLWVPGWGKLGGRVKDPLTAGRPNRKLVADPS